MKFLNSLFSRFKRKPADHRLYPDVIKAGGLGKALDMEFQKIASPLRYSKDESLSNTPIVMEVVEHENKFCQISVGAEERVFMSDFWRDGVCLAHAASDDIAELAKAINHWLADELTTQAFAEHHSIVRPNKNAKAFDNNEEVEYKWNLL